MSAAWVRIRARVVNLIAFCETQNIRSDLVYDAGPIVAQNLITVAWDVLVIVWIVIID